MINIYKVRYSVVSQKSTKDNVLYDWYVRSVSKKVKNVKELNQFKEKLKAITKIDAIDFYYKTK